MSRLRIFQALFAAGAILGSGCNSYRYMRDATPEIEDGRRDYVVNNPNNGYNDDILAGRVRTGMSRLQVRIAWGDPDRVDALGTAGNEVWAYQESEPSRGTSVYRLQFAGERLSKLDVERGVVDLPSVVSQPQHSEQPATNAVRSEKAGAGSRP